MERLNARRIIADKYRLDRPLAAGGMGSVWAAWNTHLDVPVAVKFMAAPLTVSQDLVARFEREARAAAQLRSPHVVQIFEHGIDAGMPFIVMELLEGEDLGTRMRRRGRLPLGETAHVVAYVCKALRRAHAMGIVHRDLKPANVFLARSADEEDDEELVKVLDFGVVKSLAEAVDSGVTKTGELIGTPSYMSPEQARNTKGVDHRSDLWSLGIIAYRALTATLPFPDDDGLERLMRICAEPIPPPSSVHADIGPDIDAFFARALAMDPDARFQSAREMADAIRSLAGVPVSSRSDSRTSIADGAPPSSSVYSAHAYVYTQAPDAPESEGTAAPHGQRAIPPGLHAPPSPSPARAALLFPFAPEMRPRGVPAPEAEGVTRVSGPGGSIGLRPASARPSVSIVTGALADGSGPLPPISSGDLDTLGSAGLTRSPGGGRLSSPPRAALGAGLALLVAMMAAAVLMLPGSSGSSATPAEGAGHATLLFAAGSGLPEASALPPPAASAHASDEKADPTDENADPADENSPSPAPSMTSTARAVSAASAAPSAPAAPASAAAPGSSASGATAGSARSAAPRAPARARPAPARREGGIGRRPTY